MKRTESMRARVRDDKLVVEYVSTEEMSRQEAETRLLDLEVQRERFEQQARWAAHNLHATAETISQLKKALEQ